MSVSPVTPRTKNARDPAKTVPQKMVNKEVVAFSSCSLLRARKACRKGSAKGAMMRSITTKNLGDQPKRQCWRTLKIFLSVILNILVRRWLSQTNEKQMKQNSHDAASGKKEAIWGSANMEKETIKSKTWKRASVLRVDKSAVLQGLSPWSQGTFERLCCRNHAANLCHWQCPRTNSLTLLQKTRWEVEMRRHTYSISSSSKTFRWSRTRKEGPTTGQNLHCGECSWFHLTKEAAQIRASLKRTVMTYTAIGPKIFQNMSSSKDIPVFCDFVWSFFHILEMTYLWRCDMYD